MLVKVGNKIYDGDKEPVMVILSKEEKRQISEMSPEATKYCVYPYTVEWVKDEHRKIKKWMKDVSRN